MALRAPKSDEHRCNRHSWRVARSRNLRSTARAAAVLSGVAGGVEKHHGGDAISVAMQALLGWGLMQLPQPVVCSPQTTAGSP